MPSTPQTLEEVLWAISTTWQPIVLAMVLITLLSVTMCWLLLKSNKPLWAHRFMSVPIFITTIPGILFTLILAYLLFISHANLLTLPLFYFFPPLWMVISLYLYSRMVNFDYVPGFDRLSGLALFSAIIFIVFFILARLRIVALLWVTPKMLIPMAILLYLGWRMAVKRMLKK